MARPEVGGVTPGPGRQPDGVSFGRVARRMAVWGVGGRLGLRRSVGAGWLLCPRFQSHRPPGVKDGDG